MNRAKEKAEAKIQARNDRKTRECEQLVKTIVKRRQTSKFCVGARYGRLFKPFYLPDHKYSFDVHTNFGEAQDRAWGLQCVTRPPTPPDFHMSRHDSFEDATVPVEISVAWDWTNTAKTFVRGGGGGGGAPAAGGGASSRPLPNSPQMGTSSRHFKGNVIGGRWVLTSED